MISEVPVYVFLSETMFRYGIFLKTDPNLSPFNKYFASYSTNATLYGFIVS